LGPATKRGGVLIVEDVDDTRELMAEFLMNEGYHSIMAKSGADALRRLEEIKADVIVTDLMMPEMDGAELVRRIAADARLEAIPIIIMTGSGRAKALEELGDAVRRVKMILVKPIQLGDLQRAVEAAFGEVDA